jgi:hypothetical protein
MKSKVVHMLPSSSHKIAQFPAAAPILTLAAWTVLSGCSQSTSMQPKLYQMGDRAEVGSLIYTVLEAEWKPQLGEVPSVRSPQHQFLLLRLSVTNSGPVESAIPDMTLQGPRSESYPELADGEGVPQWFGILRKLQPAETAYGRVLFDAPKGDYTLRVTDNVFDSEQAQVALIDVPLRFESRAIVLPDQPTHPAQ